VSNDVISSPVLAICLLMLSAGSAGDLSIDVFSSPVLGIALMMLSAPQCWRSV